MRLYFLIGCCILFICNNAIALTESNGNKVYNHHCAACHMSNGDGIPHVFPALKCSQVIKSDVKETINIIMFGKAGTAMMAFGSEMPKQDLNDLVLFLRKDFCDLTSSSIDISRLIDSSINIIPSEQRYTKERQAIKDKKRDKEYKKYLEDERNENKKKEDLNSITNPNALFVASYKAEKDDIKIAKYGYNLILDKFPSSPSAIEAINRLDKIALYEKFN